MLAPQLHEDTGEVLDGLRSPVHSPRKRFLSTPDDAVPAKRRRRDEDPEELEARAPAPKGKKRVVLDVMADIDDILADLDSKPSTPKFSRSPDNNPSPSPGPRSRSISPEALRHEKVIPLDLDNAEVRDKVYSSLKDHMEELIDRLIAQGKEVGNVMSMNALDWYRIAFKSSLGPHKSALE